MKPEQIYHGLKELAEKMGITVTEKNLRNAGVGIQVRSGLCMVKGKQLFIMDKHQSLREKIEILAECLGQMPHEELFVVPALRKLLEK